AGVARVVVPVGRDVRRDGHQLLALLGGRDPRRAVPVRRRRPGDEDRPPGDRRLRLARLPAQRRPRPALRLPRARAVRPGRGPALQPAQAAARPVREGHRRQGGLAPVAVLVPVRPAGPAQRRRLGAVPAEGRGGEPLLQLGHRPPAEPPLQRDRHLRGPRQGPDLPEQGHPAGDARDVRRPRAPVDDRPPAEARGHGGRADAGAPVHPRPHAAPARAAQLLGLQHDRLLRPGRGVRLLRHRGPAGPGVQGDGPGPARGGDRGDPRRGLQPHRRGQPLRPDAVHARHRQRGVLPPGRGPAGVLHGLHRHREHAERPAPAHAAADHGLAALLGAGDARRRLPLRPGLHAGPRVLRRGPAERLLRPGAAGPDGLPGQADRRAVGRRPRRLPGRQLPAALDRVERRLPGHRPGLLARRAGDAGRVRRPHHRVPRPVRALRPAPGGQHQLRHRARRLHLARPGLLQREAQRGQRRGQPGRRVPQPLLELRGRGRHRRPGDPGAAGPAAAQLHRHPVPVPGRADAAARRRDRPHPARQQQLLLPGQRHHLAGLGERRRAAGRLHRPGLRAAPRAPGVPAAPVLQRPAGAARRRGAAAGHRLVHPGRPGDGRGGLGGRLRQVGRRLPQRRRHPGPQLPGRAGHRRLVHHDLQRPRRVDRLHPPVVGVRREVGAGPGHRDAAAGRAGAGRRAEHADRRGPLARRPAEGGL
ncbi:MAG: GH13_11 / GH13 / GH13_13 / GH13_10 / CBM 48 / GH13_37 / GH13_36, partial [uncultured Corynebacteriales bacterium]